MASIERAILLRQHHRPEDAVAELSLVLAQDPESAEGHAQLAVTRMDIPGQYGEALESINRAIGLSPDNEFCFAVKALILSRMDRNKEAVTVAEEAIAVEPSALPWFAKAQALAGLQRWAEAEDACDKALSLDPDYAPAENLRTIVLRTQGKLSEADDSAFRQLSRDAEDPLTLANAGWTALQREDREKAEELFRESLRIDPDNEYARNGLLQAYKARSLFYRVYLKWVFYLQKYNAKNRWLIIIGIYLAYRFSTRLLSGNHPVAAAVLVFAYLFFALGTFVAPGLGHFLILKDPLARLSLRRHERLDGLMVGLCVLIGLASLLLGVTVLPTAVAVFGGCVLGAAIPGSLIFLNRSVLGQRVFGAIAVVAILTGLLNLVAQLVPSDVVSNLAGALLTITVLGVVLCTWLGNVPALMHRRDRT